MTAACLSDGCGDARYLSVPQRSGDRVDRGLVEHLAIAAHHARQPLAGQLSCHRAPVGRGNRVVPRRELAPPDVDVAREGEPLRRHTGWPPAERDGGSDGLRRRAQYARVHELLLTQPFRVRAADGGGDAAHDRDDIGRGRPDVDQNAVWVAAGHEARRGRPVRGRHGERIAARLIRRAPTTVHRVDTHPSVRKRLRHGVEHERDAVALRAEQLRQLGGHGDAMRIARPRAELSPEAVEQRRERGRVALDLVRHGPGGQDAGPRRSRCLRVHAADVPAEHLLHTRGLPRALPCA